jgi:hypothetical protein
MVFIRNENICLFAKKPTHFGIKSTNNKTNTKIIGSK